MGARRPGAVTKLGVVSIRLLSAGLMIFRYRRVAAREVRNRLRIAYAVINCRGNAAYG